MCVIAFPVAAQVSPQPMPRSASLVVDQVTVIDVEHGQRWPHQRVLIQGNRIRALGPAARVQVPTGAQVVDARGQYLIPGLWDLHMHAFVEADSIYHKAQAIYLQLLANGITGIRDAGSSVPLDTFQQWKHEIAAGQRIGPRLIVSGPSIEENHQECTRADHSAAACRSAPHYLYIASPNDAPHLVDSLKAAGADIIKIHDVTSKEYFALAAAARRAGIRFGGHAPRGIVGALDAAADSGAVLVDHHNWVPAPAGCRMAISMAPSELLDTLQCVARAAAHLRQRQTWLTATGISADTHDGRDSAAAAFQRWALRYAGPIGYPKADWRPLSAAERRALPTGATWAHYYGLDTATVRSPSCQGALLSYVIDLPLVLGPDFPLSIPPGPNLHLSLLDMQLCGVPPLWALQTVTRNPVQALGLADSLGTVAVGKVADLVLLAGDPLDDLWNVSKITGVVANGRYFDRRALDEVLRTAAAEWQQDRAERTARHRPANWNDDEP